MDVSRRIEKEARKYFNSYINIVTKNAQKKYGFDMTKHEYSYSDTHNNEADAFKHAYMSWFLSYWKDDLLAKQLGM